ncbi:MAG: aminotransferase class IV [Bacteroidota bacterium]
MTDGGRPVGLIETMRVEHGEVPLLEGHLARLLASARAWGYPADRSDLTRCITEAVEGRPNTTLPPLLPVPPPSSQSLRLVLWPDGSVDLTLASLPGALFGTAAVYPERVTEAGTWRCTMKTTARAHYDRALAWAAAHGLDEPILLNPQGEVSEGARTNVVIREGSRLVTPPLSSGGLDGVMRREMLRLGADERRLTPRDLTEADEVLLVNALRGAMSVELREVA